MQEYQSAADRWAFFAPWSARLRDADMRVKLQYENERTYRSKFHAIELSLGNGMVDDDDDGGDVLVDAVELVMIALARCPEAWTAVLIEQCECTEHFHPLEEPWGEALRVEFDCSSLRGPTLHSPSTHRFFRALLNDQSRLRSRAFHDALAEIDWLAQTLPRSGPYVNVTIRLTADNVDIAIADIMAFVQALKKCSPQDTTSSRCVLESVLLDWTGPDLTDGIVLQTRELVAEAPLLQVTQVTINPRDVACSAAEFKEFVVLLTRANPSIEMELDDPLWDSNSTLKPTDRGSNSDSSLALVMNTIADAGVAIPCLHIGNILTRIGQRREVWAELLGTVLSPLAPSLINSVAINSPQLLNVEEDAKFIEQLRGRDRSPTSLSLTLTNASPRSLHAIITAFAKTVRHLRIEDSEKPIRSTTVSFILQTCPRLEYLGLTNVILNSMDVFYENCGRLSTLSLTNATLSHPSSVNTFFKQLSDPHSSLGRQFSELHITREGDPSITWDKFVLRSTDLQQLHDLLQANSRVHTLHVEVEDETPCSLIMDLMAKHHNAAPVNHVPLTLACKVAWLSVTIHNPSQAVLSARHALGHDATRDIFEFAAEYTPRWVHIGKSFGYRSTAYTQ